MLLGEIGKFFIFFVLFDFGHYFGSGSKQVRGVKTTAMIDYAMKYVRMLISYASNVIMVFDGRPLTAKSMTNAKRRENREKAKIKAFELFNAGRYNEAKKEFDKAVNISHTDALELMEECRRYNIDTIVAMYEADAQLAYLNKIGLAEFIISEDSDLILFGCQKIIYKLSLDGKCLLFEHDKLHNVFPKFDFEKFRRICILSGCDYLSNLPGIGLSKAKKFFLMTAEQDMRKALRKIPSYLNLKKITISDDYIESFLRAEATFKHMFVYDPIKKAMVRLNDLTNKDDEKYCASAGVLFSAEEAFQLALGNINPKTGKHVDNYDPFRERSLKKPINSKYKPLFSIWKFSGKHENVVVKTTHQSKISFVPLKFKRPKNVALSELENHMDEQVEMDTLIKSYCTTEAVPVRIKRPSSVLDDDLSSLQTVTMSPKNPFAKRQSLELNDTKTEKADNCSLIKVLAPKDAPKESTYAQVRVVSRFFAKNINKELENYPQGIINRVQTEHMARELEIEKKLLENDQYYSPPKKVQSCPVDRLKEKFGAKSTHGLDNSEDESISEPSAPDEQDFRLDTETKEKLDERKTQPKSVPKRKATAALTVSQKLMKFGFTKEKKVL